MGEENIKVIKQMEEEKADIIKDSERKISECVNNGILVKNRNKDDMVKKIIALLKDDNKLKKLSLKGYSSCQRYLLNNVTDDWLNLLNGGKK